MTELTGRKAAIIATDEFEDLELFHPMYRLQEAGAKTFIIGLTREQIKGKGGYSIQPDRTIDEVNAQDFDFLIIPGGKSPERLRLNNKILRFVKEFDLQGKPIAAICHAGQVLASARIVRNRTLTCVAGIKDDMINAGAHYVDQAVVTDSNLVTSRIPSDLPEFAKAMMDLFSKPRLVQVRQSS